MGYFCSLVKQTAEIFPDFLTHVTIAVEKCIPLGPIKDFLIKEFTWKGHNMVMHNAIVPILNEDIYKLVHNTRDIDTENGPISALIAFINALVNANLEKNYDQPLITLIGAAEGLSNSAGTPKSLPKN